MFVVERQEFTLFLFRSFLLGAVLALLYLFLGFFRIPAERIWSKAFGRLCLVLIDLPFCGLIAFLNMLMIYASNRGQVRISALLFEVLGFLVIYLPFGRRAEKMQYRLFLLIKNRVVQPVWRFFCKKTTILVKKAANRILVFKLKSYNRKLDRIISRMVDDAIKNGEERIFPGK